MFPKSRAQRSQVARGLESCDDQSVPFCQACHAESPGTVCGWCARPLAANASAESATTQVRGRKKWFLVMAVAVGVPGLALAISRTTPSAIRRVTSDPAVASGLRGQGCDWVLSDATDQGRTGWSVVQCHLGKPSEDPAFFVDKIRRVYSKNAAAKMSTDLPYPPEVPAWSRPGIACTLSDYYDDCVAAVVIEQVGRITGQDLPALQVIADQTLSLPPGRSRAAAAKVAACGITSKDARCGSFAREMRFVEQEVARQIVAQRTQETPAP
jgi:hypothetical protein